MDPVGERPPRGRKKCTRTFPRADHFHLPGYLVRCQQIVCIQPLNVVSLAERKRLIPGCGSALVLLAENPNRFGFKLARYLQRLIRGTVINDDDLLWFPRLS